MGSPVCEDSLKKKIMSSIDTVVGMFLILERERGRKSCFSSSSKLSETSLQVGLWSSWLQSNRDLSKGFLSVLS